MALIKCESVTMSYEGVTALKNVSFELEEGEQLLILGENGSGKSTLIKGILGLKQADSGKFAFEGISPRQIGYLPQQNAVQKDFPATVREVILSGCMGKSRSPFYTKAQKRQVEECMRHLHLTDIKKKSFRELSGGQQQRVLIARALCAADKLLLLDEPVTGLDVGMTAELYDLIEHLNSVHGITIIMISHDLANALKYADKVLHIGAGGNFFGSSEEYVNSDFYRNMIGGGKNGGYSC